MTKGKGMGTLATTIFSLVIFFVISLLCLVFVVYRVSALKDAVAEKQRELNTFRGEGIANLNRQKLELEKQLKIMEDSCNKIVEALGSSPRAKMQNDVGDPLKFKEELYKVQNKMREEGSSFNFQFPFWLGFEKYEHDIPAANELSVKIKQLEIVKEIGNLMLQSKMPEITAIEFTDVKNISADEESKTPIYREFSMKIGVKCKNENLVNFLQKLSVSEIPFKVDTIKVKVSKDEGAEKGDLAAEMVITAMIFS